MNKYLVLILFFLSLFLQQGQCGDEVGNAGGIAENNVLFAYHNIASTIKYCLALESCGVDDDERQVLQAILNSLPEEYQNINQIRFISATKDPLLHRRLFRDRYENEPFAVTGNRIGSSIYININRLYNARQNGLSHITLAQAVSMLVHEFGHHHGIKDEIWLDTLGVKVAKNLLPGILRVPLGPRARNISAQIMQTNDPEKHYSFDNIMLTDGVRYFDLATTLKKAVLCPSLEHESLRLIGLSIWQPYWSQYRSSTAYLKGDLILYCKGSSSDKIYIFAGNAFKLKPHIYLNPQGIGLIKNLQFTTITCLSDLIACVKRKKRYQNLASILIKKNNFYRGESDEKN